MARATAKLGLANGRHLNVENPEYLVEMQAEICIKLFFQMHLGMSAWITCSRPKTGLLIFIMSLHGFWAHAYGAFLSGANSLLSFLKLPGQIAPVARSFFFVAEGTE